MTEPLAVPHPPTPRHEQCRQQSVRTAASVTGHGRGFSAGIDVPDAAVRPTLGRGSWRGAYPPSEDRSHRRWDLHVSSTKASWPASRRASVGRSGAASPEPRYSRLVQRTPPAGPQPGSSHESFLRAIRFVESRLHWR